MLGFFVVMLPAVEMFKEKLLEFQLMVLKWELEGIDPNYAIPQEIYYPK